MQCWTAAVALGVSTFILPRSEKLGWVVLFTSGFAGHVLSVQTHSAGTSQRQGAAPGPEVYTSSHLPTPLIPHSGDCAPMEDLSPCKLGGMRLYSHASKVKVCATLLACRCRSRKRKIFSMQLRILGKSRCGLYCVLL